MERTTRKRNLKFSPDTHGVVCDLNLVVVVVVVVCVQPDTQTGKIQV